jgi:hypothetical protein
MAVYDGSRKVGYLKRDSAKSIHEVVIQTNSLDLLKNFECCQNMMNKINKEGRRSMKHFCLIFIVTVICNNLHFYWFKIKLIFKI